MAKINYEEFIKKLYSDTTIYFKYDFEQAVIKHVHADGYYVKLKGNPEFKAKKGSVLVTDAILEHDQITKEEYDDFE